MQLRDLTADDLEACGDLAERVDWPREARKWQMLLEIAEAVGIEDGGRLVAAGLVTCFDGDLAAIGMMMVDPAHGRQGLGGRVLKALLERAGDVPTLLYGTDQGQGLYERHGFVAVDVVDTFLGRLRAVPALERTVWRVGVEALDAIGAYDRAIIGADRRRLLKPWLEKNVKCVAAYGADGAMSGYAIVWRNEDRVHIGPVLADDEATARGLIAAGLEETHVTYRIDVPRSQKDIARWVQDLGLERGWSAPLMVKKGAVPDGHPATLFALGLQATT